MPIFTSSIRKSSNTALNWSSTKAGSSAWNDRSKGVSGGPVTQDGDGCRGRSIWHGGLVMLSARFNAGQMCMCLRQLAETLGKTDETVVMVSLFRSLDPDIGHPSPAEALGALLGLGATGAFLL